MRIVTAREQAEMLSPWRTAISQSDLDDYRWERQRQEDELEGITGGHPDDIDDYFARGGKPLVTLKDWLKARSHNGRDLGKEWRDSLPPTMPWDPEGALPSFNDYPPGGPEWDEPGYSHSNEPPEENHRWARQAQVR